MFTFGPVNHPVRSRVEQAPAGTSRSEEIERLYRERGDRVWRAILAFSGDPEVASDAVAEAFAQVLRRGVEVEDPERWVWRAAFRIASGELKERRRRTVVEAMKMYEMEEPARDLVVALAKLSEKQRASVVLHDAAGYPAKEIARIVGSTEAAVRVHVMRGRRRLRELLNEDDD
ncbi:MAG TPA: sigma-70 family RNA polymerase sigma factor [Actinomycetota bacterium]